MVGDEKGDGLGDVSEFDGVVPNHVGPLLFADDLKEEQLNVVKRIEIAVGVNLIRTVCERISASVENLYAHNSIHIISR